MTMWKHEKNSNLILGSKEVMTEYVQMICPIF